MSRIGNLIAIKANAVHVALYRRSHGRRFNQVKGMPVALVTVPGRRTGTMRTTPVACLDSNEGGWIVAGSNGGAKPEPQWFRNLRATDRATLEIAGTSHDVSVRILEGAERQLWWERLLDKGEFWRHYAEKSGRVIPLAKLSPRSDESPSEMT